MDKSKELQILKQTINDLNIGLAITSAQTKVLFEFVTVLLHDICPDLPEKELYTNLVDKLEDATTTNIRETRESLLDTGDHSFLARCEFDCFSVFQSMKRDPRYLHGGKNSKNDVL